MEIMINKCYGGFDYSLQALKKYYECELNGYTFEGDKLKDDKRILIRVCKSNKDKLTSEEMRELDARGYEIERTDKKMIEIVKELGESASSPLAKIEIVEIPDGTEWEIEDYDGIEWVAEKHRTWN